MNATGATGEKFETMSLEQLAREPAKQWSEICQWFLDRQRHEILEATPTAEKLREHRLALRMMLSFAKALYLTAADPEYPDKWIADELHGRLIQLQHSWRMIHEPMPEAECESMLREVFTSKADQKFIGRLFPT
jgi:hypothetical protein